MRQSVLDGNNKTIDACAINYPEVKSVVKSAGVYIKDRDHRLSGSKQLVPYVTLDLILTDSSSDQLMQFCYTYEGDYVLISIAVFESTL